MNDIATVPQQGRHLDRFWKEVVVAGRFGLVGLAATAVHLGVVWVLIGMTDLATLAANTLAFLTAFGVSFTGHYFWTFSAPGNPRKAITRFLLISLSGFAANTFLLAGLLQTEWLSAFASVAVAIAIVPVITFLASRSWGFRKPSIALENNLSNSVNDGKQDLYMNKINLKSLSLFSFFLPILLGVTAFILIVGPRAINPANIAWLAEGDPAQHFLGWHFFRNAGWSFPLGLNPGFGLELSNAIVFSDSNPLFAFLFKPFAPLLSEPFQYFGIWLLACFVLQTWFGWKLAGLISDSVAIRTLATGLFVFAPPMIWRLHGHLSLVGHFLILAALYFSFHPGLERRRLAWGTLLAVAALVHANLLAMVALLWFADFAGKTIKKKLPFPQAVLEPAIIVSAVGIVCWQAGYFSVGAGTSEGGFGIYRMNLLSIFDASGWSYVLKDIPEAKGEYEGFNFLGLGVIFLSICTLPALIAGSTGLRRALRRFPILLIVLAGLAVYAASNKVGFGLIGFEYPLPDFVIKISNIFRASGRMFWPVFYAIVFAAIFLVVRGNDKRTAVSLLGLALVIQIADTSAAWSGIRKKLMTEPKSIWGTSLVDPFWERAASKYKKVRWIQPRNNSPKWLTLAAYAGTHGLATDAVYLARVGTAALEQVQHKASEALKTGTYEADSLYVLDDKAFRQAAFSIDPEMDVLARIDGFNILAPGWRKCADCSPIKGEVGVADLGAYYANGESLSALPRQVGQAEDTALISDGRSGFLVFGPYIPVAAGKYKLVLRGKSGSSDLAWVDVVSSKGTVQHGKFALKPATQEEAVLAEGQVQLDTPVDDIEIRVYVGSGDEVTLEGYELVPVENESHSAVKTGARSHIAQEKADCP